MNISQKMKKKLLDGVKLSYVEMRTILFPLRNLGTITQCEQDKITARFMNYKDFVYITDIEQLWEKLNNRGYDMLLDAFITKIRLIVGRPRPIYTYFTHPGFCISVGCLECIKAKEEFIGRYLGYDIITEKKHD